jgi:hypothetical protein
MPDAPSRLSRRSNENVLQIWRGRDAFNDKDVDALREELERRGLSREMAEMDDMPPSRDIYGKLPPSPRSYLGLTVPILWLRELWLRCRTRKGVDVDATIQSAQRTRKGFGSVARAELVYAYEIQSRQYLGRVVRDFSYDVANADSLVYDHHTGEKLSVRICLQDPEISYFPSGLDGFDPVFSGLKALYSWACVIAVAAVIIWELFRRL